MIDSVEVSNFRCFRDLRVGSLGRVNLIAGVNNVGKTALLEAIYLLASPSLSIWPPVLGFLRGLDKLAPNADLVTKWGWLFYGRDMTRQVTLRWGTGPILTDALVAAVNSKAALDDVLGVPGDFQSLEIRWQPRGDIVRPGAPAEGEEQTPAS